MTLKIIHPAPTECGATIPAGVIVEYLGHVVGGMVKVRWGQKECVIHPGTTQQLK